MISDDERREVAQKLRGNPNETLIEPQSDESNFEPNNMFRDFSDWFNEHMGGWDKW